MIVSLEHRKRYSTGASSQVASVTQTPSSNTGLNSQKLDTTLNWNLTARADWLQGTFTTCSSLQLERVLNAYQDVSGDKVVLKLGKGSYLGKQWANQGDSPLGFRCWYNLPGENNDGAGHLLVSFPGAVLGRLTVCQQRELGRRLLALNFKATRFDPAIDDYSKRVTFEQIRDAIEAGNYARFRKAQITKNYGDTYGGWTIYCGSRASDRFLRIYNKFAESKGQIDSIRWEGELRDKLADRYFREWIEAPDEVSAQLLASFVIGLVEFVDRAQEKNVNRMVELPWWQEFKDAVGASIRYSVEQLKTNLKQAKDWVSHQVVKTLAIVRQVVGGKRFSSWLVREIREAPERYREQDYAKLIQWQHEFDQGMLNKSSVGSV